MATTAYQRLSAAYKNAFPMNAVPPQSDQNAVNRMQFELGYVDIGNTAHVFAGAVNAGLASATTGKRTKEDD